jgi:hypothetical protein
MSSINSEERHITNLELSLKPGNFKFEFSGNVSVSQLRSILNKFINVMNISNIIKLPEIKDNDFDDVIPDLEHLPIVNPIENHIENPIENPIENHIENPIENQNISSIIYPVRECPNLGWATFSSIVIESLNRISICYRIVFPAASVKFPEITVNNGVLPVVFQGHSYPVCSCPSYYFNNRQNSIGKCKHIDEALDAVDIQWALINWSNRPDNLPYLLKEEGLIEYQWIRSPSPNM